MSTASLSNVFSDVYISGNCTVKGTISSLAGSITSQWTTTGSSIYYNTGNIGIGTATPGQLLSLNNGNILLAGTWTAGTTYSLIGYNTDKRLEFNYSNGTVIYDNNAFLVRTGGSSGGIGNLGLYQNSTGYVGIGTTNPGSLLTVSGGVGIGSGYQTITAPTGGLIVQGNVGIGTSNPGLNALQVSGNVVTSGFTSNATNTVFNFDTLTVPFVNATQVGIGNTAPTALLDMRGGNISLGSYDSSSGSRYVGFYNVNDANGPLVGMEIENTTLTGNYSQKLHFRTHWFGTNNGRRMTISEAGNVGIGVTTPQTALWVPATSTTTGIGIYNADVAMILGNTAGSTNSNTGSIQVRAGGSATGIGTGTYVLALNPEGGSVAIGANTGTAIPSQFYVRSSTATGAVSVPTGTVMTIDKSDGGILSFRQSSDNGTYSGISFLDNNIGGFVLFRNYTGASSQYGDALHISGYNGVFIYGQTTSSVDPSQQTIIMACTYKQNGSSGITSTAAVGIGTTNPVSTFNVYNGTTILSSSTANAVEYVSPSTLHLRGASGGSTQLIWETVGYNTAAITSGATSPYGLSYGTQAGDHVFRTGCSYNGDFSTTGTERMRITAGGNVSYSTTYKQNVFYAPPNWSYSTSSTSWQQLWSFSYTLSQASYVTVSVQGHWQHSSVGGYSYIQPLIDGNSPVAVTSYFDSWTAGASGGSGGTFHDYWYAGWQGFACTVNVKLSAGSHTFGLGMNGSGGTIYANGAGISLTAIPINWL
jgi:hypothetical protein